MELTRQVQDQILSELNQLTDVCDVLKSLHIAIGFLSSAGGDPSMSIRDYLSSMFCRCGTGGCVPSGMCTLGDVYPRGCVPSGMCTLGTLQEVTSQSTSPPEVTS